MCYFIFCCKQKSAYEMRISDCSSDVCSSDLHWNRGVSGRELHRELTRELAELGRRQIIDARRCRPSATGREAPAQLIGALLAIQWCAHADEVMTVGFLGQHCMRAIRMLVGQIVDRKSTRLNSSH